MSFLKKKKKFFTFFNKIDSWQEKIKWAIQIQAPKKWPQKNDL